MDINETKQIDEEKEEEESPHKLLPNNLPQFSKLFIANPELFYDKSSQNQQVICIEEETSSENYSENDVDGIFIEFSKNDKKTEKNEKDSNQVDNLSNSNDVNFDNFQNEQDSQKLVTEETMNIENLNDSAAIKILTNKREKFLDLDFESDEEDSIFQINQKEQKFLDSEEKTITIHVIDENIQFDNEKEEEIKENIQLNNKEEEKTKENIQFDIEFDFDRASEFVSNMINHQQQKNLFNYFSNNNQRDRGYISNTKIVNKSESQINKFEINYNFDNVI